MFIAGLTISSLSIPSSSSLALIHAQKKYPPIILVPHASPTSIESSLGTSHSFFTGCDCRSKGAVVLSKEGADEIVDFYSFGFGRASKRKDVVRLVFIDTLFTLRRACPSRSSWGSR
jgi:hypothetical protein